MKANGISRISSRTLVALGMIVVALAAHPVYAGAPLKGVDIKLGKNPGGQIAARSTDGNGKVTFGIVPKGSYYISVAPPSASAAGTVSNTATSGSKQSDPSTKSCLLTIDGAVAGPIKTEWSFETNSILAPTPAAATTKTKNVDKVMFDSDGVHPISAVIVRSKSNITNN